LWPDQLELRQVAPGGEEQLRRFNPFYVKLDIDRDFDERTTALHLRTRDDDIEIGAFLSSDDKASFAKVFGTALKKARNLGFDGQALRRQLVPTSCSPPSASMR